jgi:biotin transport system substrate-specific component
MTGSLITAVLAQVSIYLPFSPVPITGQTLAVLLVGATLGSRRGTISQILYLFEGAIGLPVFAGGNSTLIYVLGPTGGYLIGFVFASFLMGWFSEHGWDRKKLTVAIAAFLGNIVIYIFGLTWLSRFFPLKKILTIGFYPFITGDILKIFLLIIILPSCWKLINWINKSKK